MISFSLLENKIKNCNKCPLLVKTRNTIVLGYGDKNADIMFVGLAPGRNGADKTGIPFTRDPSGVLFQEAMIKAGFSLENESTVEKPKLKNVYVTNVVKCNPKDAHGNNRYPLKKEIHECINYFMMEKELINPKVIVLLGKTTAEWILDSKFTPFLKYHNDPINQDGIIYIPFIHPSYIVRGAYNRKKYLQEFSSLFNLIKKNE